MLAIRSMRHRTPTPEDAAYTVCAQPATTMFGISFSRPSVPRFAAPPNALQLSESIATRFYRTSDAAASPFASVWKCRTGHRSSSPQYQFVRPMHPALLVRGLVSCPYWSVTSGPCECVLLTASCNVCSNTAHPNSIHRTHTTSISEYSADGGPAYPL